MNWKLAANSLALGAGATLLALALGFCAALWLTTWPERRQRWGLWLCALPLALPPFLAVNCWMHLVGLAGTWRAWIPINLYSMGPAIVLLAATTWPVATFFTLAAFRRAGTEMLEAEPALRGSRFLLWLAWPLARHSLTIASILILILNLGNFTIPALLQIKVFPAELWIEFNTRLSVGGALLACWPLLLAPLPLWWLLRGSKPRWPAATPAASGVWKHCVGRAWLVSAAILTAVAFSISVAIPMGQIALDPRTWLELPSVARAGSSMMWNSFYPAAIAATICSAISLFLWDRRGAIVLWIPFLLPGVLVGVALARLFSTPAVAFMGNGFALVILAWVLRFSILSRTVTAHAFREVDPTLIEAARLEGARRWPLVRLVYWPLVRARLAMAWYVIFLLGLWEVESLVFLCPPGGETLALRIFNLLHYGHTGQVNALCLALLAMAGIPCLLAHWFQPVPGRGWKTPPDSALLKPFAGIPALGCLGLLTVFVTGCSPVLQNPLPPESIFSEVRIIGTRGAGAGQFNKPRSVAVDASNNLYAVDMTGRVQKFSPNGDYLGSWQMPQTDLGKPKGMYRHPSGGILVLEPHYSRVNQFEPDGKLAAQWGTHGTNAGQLAFPRAVAAGPTGEVYVSEYGLVERVQCFAPPGMTLKRAWGRPGSGHGEFNRPEGLGLDSAGNLYVADSCNHRVQVFSGEGQFLKEHGSPGNGPGQLSYPYDVRVDVAGLEFVCEFGNSRIQVFDSQGRTVEILGGPGSAPGQFGNPWSIALDSQGNLYVADSGNHRVQKFIRKQPATAVRALARHTPNQR